MEQANEKPRYWPRIADADGAVALLQRESVWHIGGYDGCLCTWLKVMNYDIDIGCRKGRGNGKHVITVTSTHFGVTREDLLKVAHEVERQVREQENHIETVIVAERR